VRTRLQDPAVEIVQVAIISFQEQVEGWLAFINRAKTPQQILHGYGELLGLLTNYANAVVIPFDQAAQDCFTRLRKLRLRLGTMDLRIASIALTSDAWCSRAPFEISVRFPICASKIGPSD
jgi:tRNA(fMet)-specific endonuclease VapC